MKASLWVEGCLIEGEIDKKDINSICSIFKTVKRYIKPNREPDFIHNGLIYYVTEGLAFDKASCRTYAYETFYNKKENVIGVRQVKSVGRFKKVTNYLRDNELTKKYLDTMAENVILRDMDEPKDFGKVPKMR